MGKQFIRKTKSKKKKGEFDPQIFKDPFALEVSWDAASRGGGGAFKFHTLHYTNSSRCVFRATFAGILISFILFAIGITPLITVGLNIISIGFFLIFGLVGFYGIFFGTAPIVFDKNKGCFWMRNWFGPKEKKLDYFCRLEDIHAIQIISEIFTSRNGSSIHKHSSYELNIILNNKKRINVLDYGQKKDIKKYAKMLSLFLNVPLWDASDYITYT